MSELLVLQIRPSAIIRIDPATGDRRMVVEDAGPTPDGIAVVDDTIYWTTMGEPRRIPDAEGEAGRDYSAKNGGVHAVCLDGSGRRDILPAGALTTGKQLTSDGNRLYWGDREGCRVSACGLDGSGRTDLVAQHRDGTWMKECVGVAVDPEGGWIYWTQKGPAKGGAGRILRAPLTAPADPWARADIETLWDGLPEPIDLELEGKYLYWTDRGAEPAGNTLNRAPVPEAGERGAEPEILAGDFSEAIGLAVDADRGLVYVSDLSGEIRAVPLPGSGREEFVVARLDGPVTGIALRS
jgi:sugar lactone lactonase YvrE